MNTQMDRWIPARLLFQGQTRTGRLNHGRGATTQIFFTNAAELLLRSQDFPFAITNGAIYTTQYMHFGVTNIPVYSSTNTTVHYTPKIHRFLQLAANLYDATTNSADPRWTNFPSVFK